MRRWGILKILRLYYSHKKHWNLKGPLLRTVPIFVHFHTACLRSYCGQNWIQVYICNIHRKRGGEMGGGGESGVGWQKPDECRWVGREEAIWTQETPLKRDQKEWRLSRHAVWITWMVAVSVQKHPLRNEAFSQRGAESADHEILWVCGKPWHHQARLSSNENLLSLKLASRGTWERRTALILWITFVHILSTKNRTGSLIHKCSNPRKHLEAAHVISGLVTPRSNNQVSHLIRCLGVVPHIQQQQPSAALQGERERSQHRHVPDIWSRAQSAAWPLHTPTHTRFKQRHTHSPFSVYPRRTRWAVKTHYAIQRVRICTLTDTSLVHSIQFNSILFI